jgi:spermidine/putrescine transport system substrate-binding protein
MTRSLTTLALLLSSAAAAQAEGVLNLYNWGNYTSPELLEKFEAETGIKVTVTDYDSNDTALAKIEAGGAGFDLVVPSANYLPIYIEKGLVQELDHSRLTNIGNIIPDLANPDWDPGRRFSVPWQSGSTGVGVNRDAYTGDINTSAIFLDPPPELEGRINVVPEMNDVVAFAVMYVGGEPCTEDLEILKKARDVLVAAKPKWMSMEYSTIEKMTNGDFLATTDYNGSALRQRLANPKIEFGYPVEGYILWADSVALLADAVNVENAYRFLDFIMLPENAAMLSTFARYANGISGSEPFMPEDMKTAPEIVPPEEFRAAGNYVPTCPPKAQEYISAIWTEINK